MSLKNWRVVMAGLYLVGACGEDVAEEAEASSRDGGSISTPDKPSKPGKADAGSRDEDEDEEVDEPGEQPAGESKDDAGASVGTRDDAAVPTQPEEPVKQLPCDYENKAVKLDKDLVVPAGKTVHVCQGVTFTAAKNVKVDVLGELIVDGSADAKVSFLGAGTPRSWHGIVIEKGGKLTLKHATVGGAAYGLFAMPGSTYTVDRSEFNTSFKAGILQADGRVTNSRFIATTPPTIAITDQVAVDDPNGTLTIMDASPTIENCSFDGSSGFTDMVRVGGKSSPTFDHVYLHNAHCGFHTFGGTNTSPRITNSVFESLAYGIMAYTTKPIIENSVFKDNSNDVGICNGATADNTPMLKNNSYEGGAPSVDASCFRINTTDPSPATTPNPSAGPSGL